MPASVFAQETLVNIPGLTGRSDFDGYINAIYAMFISIAALLAVVKLIVAGVKYMFSDIVTQKSDAKRDIQGALLGLLVVLSAVLILNVINPNLTSFDTSGIMQMERFDGFADLDQVINQCAASDLCFRTTCQTDDCAAEIIDCEGSGRDFFQNGNKLACVGSVSFQATNNNASVDSVRCSDTFYIDVQSDGSNTTNCCTGDSCPNLEQIGVGATILQKGRVYTKPERDVFAAAIKTEFPDSYITTIPAVSNDGPKLTEINNNTGMCSTNGYQVDRLHWENGGLVNVDIVCTKKD